jgi:hypothetical protein
MTPSGRFECPLAAEEYWRSHPAVDSRILEVNEADAAFLARENGVLPEVDDAQGVRSVFRRTPPLPSYGPRSTYQHRNQTTCVRTVSSIVWSSLCMNFKTTRWHHDLTILNVILYVPPMPGR